MQTTWTATLSAHLDALHALAMDATSRRGQRRYSRAFLRGAIAREHKRIRDHLRTIDAALPADAPAESSDEK